MGYYFLPLVLTAASRKYTNTLNRHVENPKDLPPRSVGQLVQPQFGIQAKSSWIEEKIGV